MSPDSFDSTFRSLLTQLPFQPFVVEFDSGQTLLIEKPSVAFGGGGASCVQNGDIILIDCESVRTIQVPSQKAG